MPHTYVGGSGDGNLMKISIQKKVYMFSKPKEPMSNLTERDEHALHIRVARAEAESQILRENDTKNLARLVHFEKMTAYYKKKYEESDEANADLAVHYEEIELIKKTQNEFYEQSDTRHNTEVYDHEAETISEEVLPITESQEAAERMRSAATLPEISFGPGEIRVPKM